MSATDNKGKIALLENRIMELETLVDTLSRRTDTNEEEIKSIKAELIDLKYQIWEIKTISQQTSLKIDKMSDQTYEQLQTMTQSLIDLVHKDSNYIREEAKKNNSWIKRASWKPFIWVIGIGSFASGIIWAVISIIKHYLGV